MVDLKKEPEHNDEMKSPRLDHLDGVRCFLFLSIFIYHANPVWGHLTYAVPLFFVLSGFLITKNLIHLQSFSLGTALKVFYFHRCLRIFPSYYAALTLFIFLGMVSYPQWHFFYLFNLKYFSLTWNPAHYPEVSYLLGPNFRNEAVHFWSLCVEEQFYLLYPLLFLTLPEKSRVWVLTALMAGSAFLRVWFMSERPTTFYGLLLPVCMEYLLSGALMALGDERGIKKWPRTFAFGGATLVLGLIWLEKKLGLQGFIQFTPRYFQTPVALAAGIMIWGFWSLPGKSLLARIFSFPPFVYLGKLSYNLYVVHMFSWYAWAATCLVLSRNYGIDPSHFIPFHGGAFVLTLLMGMVLWHGLDKPLQRFKFKGKFS